MCEWNVYPKLFLPGKWHGRVHRQLLEQMSNTIWLRCRDPAPYSRLFYCSLLQSTRRTVRFFNFELILFTYCLISIRQSHVMSPEVSAHLFWVFSFLYFVCFITNKHFPEEKWSNCLKGEPDLTNPLIHSWFFFFNIMYMCKVCMVF